MKRIAYCNPFVPPEWIAAHGLQPCWMRLRSAGSRRLLGTGRAVCPYAAALIEHALSGIEASALILTTTCDQMRLAAAVLQRSLSTPVFLMNVTSTWQTAAVQQLYLNELKRLGRFVTGLGGRSPAGEDLAEVMMAYDRARSTLRRARERLPAWRLARAIAELRGDAVVLPESRCAGAVSAGAPLALVGGPLLEKDRIVFNWIEQAGGRLVLDATEGGERTLPAPFDPARIQEDPLAELSRAYFLTIPDVRRRPNHGFYTWLGQELAARKVRGILFHRYVWCDLWRAELARLKQWSPAPVVEIDACDGGDPRDQPSARIEALMEMLQ